MGKRPRGSNSPEGGSSNKKSRISSFSIDGVDGPARTPERGSPKRLNLTNFDEFEFEHNMVVLIEGILQDDNQIRKLQEEIRTKDIIILKENCKEGDLSDFAVVSPEGKFVMIKYGSQGRTQQVVVINEEGNESFTTIAKPEDANENKSETQLKSNESEGEKPEEMLNKLIHTNLCRQETSESGSGCTEEWKQFVTLNYVNYSRKITLENINIADLETGQYDAFFTIHIELFCTKTPANKWIKFKLTDAVGMKSSMGCDHSKCRGFFNQSASIYIFPGHSTPNSSLLPPGWCRPYMEPRTSNSETKYTCTTGWSVGLSAGATANPCMPSVTAGVTANYDQKKQVECSIPDFKVRNISDGSMTGWNFYYTNMDGDENLQKHFKSHAVKPIADLAKSTLTFNAECVYQGPLNSNEKMTWSFLFEPAFALLRIGNGTKGKMFQFKEHFDIHKKSFSIKAVINTTCVGLRSEAPYFLQ